MGFCFEAGADEDTISGRQSGNAAQHGGGELVTTLLPALAVPPRSVARRRGLSAYCIKPEPRRTVGLVYRRDRRCVAVMSNWQRPSVAQWMGRKFRRALKQAV